MRPLKDWTLIINMITSFADEAELLFGAGTFTMSRFPTTKADSISIVERRKRNQITLWLFICNQLLLVDILITLTLVLGISISSWLPLALITTLISSNPLITLHTKLRRGIWWKRPPKTPRRWRHSSRHEAIGLRWKGEGLLHLIEVKHLLLRGWLLLVCLPLPTTSSTSTSTSTSLSHGRFFNKTFFLNAQTTQPRSLLWKKRRWRFRNPNSTRAWVFYSSRSRATLGQIPRNMP
jgi:hypothetical protein